MICKNIEKQNPKVPTRYYQIIKEMINQGSRHTEHHKNRKIIVFFFKYCVKMKYYFYFKKKLIMLG